MSKKLSTPADVTARFPGRRVVGAGEFKAKCLKLMDEVPFVGRSPGVIHISPEDLLAPIGEDWMPGADLSIPILEGGE